MRKDRDAEDIKEASLESSRSFMFITAVGPILLINGSPDQLAVDTPIFLPYRLFVLQFLLFTMSESDDWHDTESPAER